MIKFIKDVSLAIDLLNIIDDKPSRIVDMAPKVGTSKFYLERVVRKLNHHGLLKTARGCNGGVTKVDRPISLLDVAMAFYKKPNPDTSTVSGAVNAIYLEVLSAISIFENSTEITQIRSIYKTPINDQKQEEKPEKTEEQGEIIDDLDLGSW